jgi:hypothetical protein
VSCSEDPREGWSRYCWDAVAGDGTNDGTMNRAGDAGDYPLLGIDQPCAAR